MRSNTWLLRRIDGRQWSIRRPKSYARCTVHAAGGPARSLLAGHRRPLRAKTPVFRTGGCIRAPRADPWLRARLQGQVGKLRIRARAACGITTPSPGCRDRRRRRARIGLQPTHSRTKVEASFLRIQVAFRVRPARTTPVRKHRDAAGATGAITPTGQGGRNRLPLPAAGWIDPRGLHLHGVSCWIGVCLMQTGPNLRKSFRNFPNICGAKKNHVFQTIAVRPCAFTVSVIGSQPCRSHGRQIGPPNLRCSIGPW